MAESTILVNAEWKNESTGNTVTYNGKTYTIGSDAFGSIQTAVDAAQAGAIINVAKGEYAEDVTISKALTLNGASGYASKVTSIGIGADHVTIQGFSIKPAKQNCLGSNKMPLAAGVYLTADGAGNPLQDITVTNNRIDCSGTMEAGVKATGVAFGTGPDSHFSTNVVVSNNRITGGNSDTAQNGIYLRFVDGATVAGNTVSDFSHHLVQFETGGNYTVSNNVLSNTDRNGIQFGGDTPGTNTVTGNSISNCRGSSSDDAALVLRNAGDGSLSVSGNNITDSTTGVYISNVTEVTGLMVSGNVIDSNTTDIVSDNASKVTLSGNNYGSEAATTKGNVDAGTSVDAETGEEKFIINAAFSSQKTVAGLDGKFYTVGTNAFATLPDAIAALSAQTEELEVTGTVNWPGNQTLDLSGTTGKIILTFNGLTGPTLGAYKNYIIGNDSTVVVFDNVDADCHIFLQNLEEVILTGNSSVRITTYNNNDNQSTTTFTEVGKLTVESGSVCDFANANQFGLRGTTIAGGGTIRTSGTLLISGDTSGFTGTLEITNGVQMESVASGFANASQIINNGTMYCNAAGRFTYANTITGDGMIKAWVQNAGTDVVLTGDLSGYTGQFDALSGNTIKLNTKLHDTINLAHSSGAAGMIELNGDGNSKDIIINSTTNTSTALKIFANWNNITVQSNGNETSTVLGTIYFGGNGNAAEAEDLKVALSSINQTDGKSIGNLYFGGIGNTVSDGADADTNAIYVVVDTNYGAIVGGGQQSTINGDITFDVVTGAFGAQIVGAGDGNTIGGNISINVSSADDASVGNIIGGQAVHEVSGNISIAIADGTVGNVYGLNSGDANGTAVGNIQIDVTGGTVSSIRGGNSTSGKVPGAFEAKSVKINLTGGEVTGKIYGGSQLTTNSIAVVVDGGTAADIFAGSKYAAVETASIEVKSGSVGSIYGGGAGGADDEDGAIGISSVESSRITVSGGTVNGEIYGGGTEGDATKSAAINITGGTIKDDIYGGGYGEASVGNASVTIDGTNVTFSGGKISIYGGGNGTGAAPSGSVSKVGTASVSLTNVDQGETMLYVYGGGIYGQQSVTGSTVTIKDSTVWNVYGGLANGTGSVETAEIVMNGSTAQNVYGGSMMASTGAENTSVTLTGGSTVANVYGGGENGGVTDDVAVIVNGASVTGELNLGSASGSAAVSGTATLTVSGGNNTINGVTANGIEGGSTINVQDGSKIAGVSSDGALTITGNGVFTAAIEAESLTAETLTFEVTQAELAKGALVNVTGSGSSLAAIEIKLTDGDLSSFNGAQLLSGNIDSTGLTITLTDETASSVTVEKGDMGALLVNSDWAGITAGALVLYDGAYYEIGTNAFANLTDAVGAAAEEATILVADGTYDESVVVSGNRNLEIGDIQITSLTLGTKDEAFTGSFTLDSLTPVNGSASDKNGRLVLLNGEFASSTDMSAGTIWLGNSDFDTPDAEALKGVSYTISAGTVSVDCGFYVGCANPDADDPNKNSHRRGYYTLTVTGTGSLDAPSANLNIRQDGVFNLIGEEASANLSQYHVYGEANISEGATLETSNLLIYNDDHKAEMTVKDSTVTVRSGLNVGYTKFRNGTLNLDNSVLNANVVNLGSYGDAGTSPLYPYPGGYEKAQLNLSNGAELKATGTFEIKDTGVLNLTDSTLTATNTITNNGTINVAGTSTVAAEIDGALDLLDDTDVTFKGGAKDLLVESGAEVTLRGELSGNEVVYEKGYKYNAGGAQGITVNIDSGEGTTLKSYVWYASNGSTYNVQSGSSAEITYANINATGTINVAEGATLTVGRESSNILGTLNVDGTINSVMTVYAGYTGGEYADGAQAGLVNITGTANSSIVTIGTAVRDNDKYNAAAAEGANTIASIVVNGGTFNVTGQEGELTSKLFVGSTEYAGTLSAVNGTINVGARSAAGTGYMRFLIGKKGALNLDNSTMTVYNLGGRNNSANGVFQNSGEINMDVDSQIITATVLANSGTITVDMTDATEFNVYKLIDYTGTGTVTNYGKVELDGKNDYGYVASVLNNDLYLVRKDGATEYYVNSEWSSSNLYDEVTFVDGTKAYYGLNAFDTVDHALTATSYENGIWLNVTGDIGAITVVGTDVTEVNASAKDQIDPETGTVAADAIVVNLVDINNTNAGWQVYYPLASGSNAQIYGDITTNFLSTTFTWGEKTADPNFIGGAYAGSTATVYGNTTVNLGAVDAADDTLQLDTSFLMGAGAGTVNGNSSVNINSGTVEADAIVGGAAWRGQVKGDSSVTISGGQITVNSAPDAPGFAIMGGSYGSIGYDPEAPGAPAATAGSSSVTITGDAVVTGKVIGGSDQTAVTNSSVEISGEAQVTGNVYGGGNRGGEVKETATVKLVDTATVDGNVYGGGFGTETAKSTVQGSTRVEVSGGTVTGNVYGGGENSSVGNTSVVVDGADVEAGIYGGSLNGDAGDTTVTISNFTRLQPVPGTQSDKIQIVGGGMAEAGKSSTTASTNVTVTDSKIYGDVVAGSSATGTGATAISGKSVVNVSNLEINGYSEGSNIWTGRVFGAGRAQNGGSVVTESTDVTIENMSGYTYDSEGHIIDGSNKGARVYGAGQAYASMSRVEVGETKLRISGDATNISEIYGGGIVSGTEVQEKAAFQIVGKTDVEITGGTVTDVIAGGNNTNWFGRTVIGVDAGDGTYQAAEGEYGIRLVIGGSTKVNEGALVTGGSYVDFAYEYQNIVDGVDTYGRTAEIYGNTYMELTGDSVISTDVFGGSFAYYEQVDFSADVSKLSAPSATQYGDVTVVVSGNTAIAGSVYGGGAAVTNSDQVKTTSVTNGDVSVLISGGTVSGNVYAGGYYADVNGNASVTLTGGTVGGDVYGGSEGTGTVGSSTLNVGATDAARYTTTLNNVYDFDVANITNAAVTVEGVFSATQISIADSTLTLNSGFDAATTTVSIEVGAYNAENAALVLGSAVGTAPAISISAGSNALTEARYLVATGFDDTTAFSLDESLTGEYILRAVDGNIYLYNADAPYFTTELSVTQAEGASVDGYYSFTANFEAAGLLTGYTLKLYDSATATTPVDEVTLDADAIGQEFTLENTTQSFWISVTANGENGLSTDSPTSGRLEVVVKDYDSPVIQSVSSNVASDAITLTCEATDNFGVTGYEFILDGQSLGVQTGSEIALDLSTLTAGTHSYTVNVYDAAGNLATSAEQSFDFTPEPGPGPEPGPTEPANFLYSSQVRMDNGETVSVYATYSDAAAALEYRIGDSGEWLTYDATTGVNVSSSTTVYFREQGITDPVETAVDVTVVPADVELNAEVILLAPTTDTTYEVIYNFADGGSKAVELSGNSVEHYALPENTTVTIVEKDASGEVVNTIVEETPAASTTAEIPDKVVAVDDGHDNLFFAMPVGKWTGNRAQHQGDGVWGGTLEVVSLTGKNRFSTVFTGSDDATTLFLTDDANGDAFFLDDIYTANGSDARIRKMSEIQAGAGDDIVDLTSVRYAYEEHASKQLTIRGGDGNDILWGNAGHNIMFGDDGNDKIYGGSDNDVLIGGTGNDTMLGGGGDDIFCYGSSFDWGSDTITQLSGGTVTLYLDGIDRNDCSISGSTLTWNDGTHTGSITLNGVSWDSVKFYCAANGDGDLTKQSDYEELKNKGAFAAISSH